MKALQDEGKPSSTKQAYLSKTRNHRYQCAYWNWADDITYSGPHLGKSCQFFMRDGLATPSGLGSYGEEAAPAIDYTEVEQVVRYVHGKIVSSILRFLGTITMLESINGSAWGTKGQLLREYRYWSHRFSKNFENRPLKVWRLQASRSCSNTWALPFKIPRLTVDWAEPFVDRRGQWDFNHCESLYQIALPPDEVVYGKGAKKAIPERRSWLEHLARKSLFY